MIDTNLNLDTSNATKGQATDITTDPRNNKGDTSKQACSLVSNSLLLNSLRNSHDRLVPIAVMCFSVVSLKKSCLTVVIKFNPE